MVLSLCVFLKKDKETTRKFKNAGVTILLQVISVKEPDKLQVCMLRWINLRVTGQSTVTVSPSCCKILRYTSISVKEPSSTAHFPLLCTSQAIFSA